MTWSEQEIILLKKYFPKSSREELMSIIPSRSLSSVKNKAERLGIKRDLGFYKKTRQRPLWEKKEIALLQEYYPRLSKEKLLIKFPNRSPHSIEHKASRLGLKKDWYSDWSEEEVEILKRYYPDTLKEIILEKLNDKTWDSVLSKSLRLNLERGSEIQVNSRKKTNLHKYGMAHTSQCLEIKEKIKKTNKKRYGKENYAQTEEYREKFKNTCLINFGVEYPAQCKKVKDKKYRTMKKNGTFNTSKSEKEILKFLQAKYSDINYQYKSEEYPYNCDFYIPSLDLYIEFQGSWTHGKEPFNGANLNPKWEEGANKGSKYYKNAIQVYTKKDPSKRKTVLENNLNYLEIWYSDYKKGFEHILSLIHSKSIRSLFH